MVNKPKKRYSAILATGEKHIRNMRYHFTYTRMAITKKILRNIEDEVEKLELSYVADKNIKCSNSLENSLATPQKFKSRLNL